MVARPALEVAVIMRREAVRGAAARWSSWSWVLADVVAQASLDLPSDQGRRPLPIEPDLPSGHSTDFAVTPNHWLFPGHRVELFRDDAEGLYLNASTDRPCFWVLWRLEHDDPQRLPVPIEVTLSYHDAGRWLDAQERVDQVPAPAEVVAWLRSFVDDHYQPEPKRRRRPQSFRTLTDRFGNAASISTDKRSGRGDGGGNLPPGAAPPGHDHGH